MGSHKGSGDSGSEPAPCEAASPISVNDGAPGVDGMSVERALDWLKEHKARLIQSLLDGSYQPSPVRGCRHTETQRRNPGTWDFNGG